MLQTYKDSFLIEKVTSSRVTLWAVKKTRNRNSLVEVDVQRQVKKILKIKTFHTRCARMRYVPPQKELYEPGGSPWQHQKK